MKKVNNKEQKEIEKILENKDCHIIAKSKVKKFDTKVMQEYNGRKSEDNTLQKPAEKYLKENGIRYISRYNEAKGGSKYGIRKDTTGCPDLIIFFPMRQVVFCEFKMKGKELNNKQAEYRNYLVDRLYPYYFIDDIDKFYDMAKSYANNKYI